MGPSWALTRDWLGHFRWGPPATDLATLASFLRQSDTRRHNTVRHRVVETSAASGGWDGHSQESTPTPRETSLERLVRIVDWKSERNVRVIISQLKLVLFNTALVWLVELQYTFLTSRE